MIDTQTLFAAAHDVRLKAHAPYSNFLVGVAIEDNTGKLHVGCNVENAAFPAGVCAEGGAIGAMVASGGKRIVKIAVVAGKRGADTLPECLPCGGCRQRIAEFAQEGTEILAHNEAGEIIRYTVDDLLPSRFSL